MLLLLLAALMLAKPPQVHYTLTVDSANLSVLTVQMRIANAPDSFTVASHAHPEYDDKYWRYLEDMRADGAQIVRRDSVLWKVTGAGRLVTLNYRIRLPETALPRAAWRAYLTPKGGLVGGPHSFLYVVGAENAPVTVSLALPRGWTAATALNGPSGQFNAANVFQLMESPMLVGQLRDWQFRVKNTPHHVYYLPGATPTPFDTTAFVSGIQRVVEQATNVFTTMPYSNYFFLIADDAYGGLEHPNSVTLGVPAKDLAEDPNSYAREIGHEFFHTWNLMSIRPAEYRNVDYRVQPPVPSLWFSEGLSIFYSDLMRRRAGFTMEEPTRTAYLQYILARYMSDPSYDRFSAETISRVAYNSAPGALGNYTPSAHLVGEVIANALDLLVRDATDGRRNMDDVMRLMEQRFSRTGFTGRDVERVVADVCSCNTSDFFDRHVRGHERIDLNRYLAPLGLRMTVTTAPAVSQSGETERDFRIAAWLPAPNDTLRLSLFQGGGIWGKAGLNAGDRVLSVNGTAVQTWPQLRSAIVAVPLGGTVTLDIVRAGKRMQVPVVMRGFDRTRVEVSEVPNRTARQQRLLTEWLAGR